MARRMLGQIESSEEAIAHLMRSRRLALSVLDEFVDRTGGGRKNGESFAGAGIGSGWKAQEIPRSVIGNHSVRQARI
jgi:hypothetical protein